MPTRSAGHAPDLALLDNIIWHCLAGPQARVVGLFLSHSLMDDTPPQEGKNAPAELAPAFDFPESAPKATPYRVLARKYRPTRFEDLIGQEPMVRTLANSFTSGRIHQAYILTGVRGIGKTTTARILARAFNYSLPGKIDKPSVDMPELGVHCQAIIESRHVDVIEMDAASHTGIDDEGLKHLENMVHLRVLDLTRTRVTSKGMAYLKKMVDLVDVTIADTAVDDAGLCIHRQHARAEEKPAGPHRLRKGHRQRCRKARDRHAAAPASRRVITCPARAPLWLPSCQVTVPLTMTVAMPSAGSVGFA